MSAAPRLYAAYGLTVASDVALPELAPAVADGAADVTIRLGPVDMAMPEPSALRRVEIAADRAGLAWQGLARFRVTGGQRIELDPLPGADPIGLSLALLGPVLAALLHQRGLLVLHAAGLSLPDGRAVLFAGDNGAGKSTLAAACARAGLGFHGDDVCAVQADASGATLLPGVPVAKLARPVLDALAPFPGDIVPGAPAAAAKLRVRVHGFASAAAPIARLYILRRGDAAAVAPLTQSTALAAVLRHLYSLKFGSETLAGASGAAAFRQAAALADRVTVATLTVPDGLDRLDEAVAAVIADCGATGSSAG